MERNSVYLLLFDTSKLKKFKKYFNTEFEKDKFIRKLRYSKKLKVLEDSTDKYYK